MRCDAVVKSRIAPVTDHLGLALLLRTSFQAISKLHSGDILPCSSSAMVRIDGEGIERGIGTVIGVARILELTARFYEPNRKERKEKEEHKTRTRREKRGKDEVNDVKSEREIGRRQK